MQTWAWKRFIHRYHVGSMRLDKSEPDFHIGVNTVWRLGALSCTARLVDAWAAGEYGHSDHCPLKPWCPREPTQQQMACVRGLLARCFYLAIARDSFRYSVDEAFGLLIWQAHFPKGFVVRTALRWAKQWQPKPLDCAVYPFARQVADISNAITIFEVAEPLL